MAQVARANAEAGGGPASLRSLSVEFRGMGLLGEEIVVTGSVRSVSDGVAVVDCEARQAGRRIIRNGVAEVVVRS
jgi:hypothetical protein